MTSRQYLLPIFAAAVLAAGWGDGPLEQIAILEDTRSLGEKGELLEFLSHGDPKVRSRACLALGRIQAPDAIASLRGRLKDPDLKVRQEAAFALGQIALLHPDPSGAGDEVGAEVIKTLGRLTGADPALRLRAVEALGKIGGEVAASILDGLTEDPDADLREEVALGLARVRPVSASAPLRALLDDDSADVRAAAAYALGRVSGPLPVEDLMKAAKDVDPMVRLFAYRVVRRRDDPRGLPIFEAGLQEEDPMVLTEVLSGLAANPPASLFREIQRLRKSSHAPVRAALARCLGRSVAKQAPGLLRTLAQDPSPMVRAEVALAWGEREDGLDGAVRGIEDVHFHVRAAACRALGKILSRSREEAILIVTEPLSKVGGDDAEKMWRVEALLSSPIWIGTDPDSHGAKFVLSHTEHPIPEIRAAAARAARLLDPGPARPVLLGLTRDEDAWVRAEAALSLHLLPGGRLPGRIKDPPTGASGVLAALRYPAIEELLEAAGKALKAEDHRVRAFAARALEAAGSEGARIARKGIEDPDESVARFAAGTLVRTASDLGDIAALADREEERTRLLLAAYLPEAPAEIAAELLGKLTSDPSPVVREFAAFQLAWTTGEALAAEKYPDGRVAMVATVLALAGSAYRAIEKMMADDNVIVQAAALEALAPLPTRVAIARHLDALASDDPGVAFQAAKFFRSHPVRAAVPALAKAYPRWQPAGYGEVRLEVIRALAASGDDPSRETIEKACTDPDPLVREEARLALRDLYQKDPESSEPPPAEPSRYLANRSPLPADPTVAIDTSRGKMIVRLFPDAAPIHCRNFLRLVGEGFYDGLTIHRVVPNFVIQGGDPLGTGWGYAEDLLRDEINTVRYVTGTVGMPKAGKDTGGCQFFITHVPVPRLDGAYTAFGQVTIGLDVLDKIEVGDRIDRMTIIGKGD